MMQRRRRRRKRRRRRTNPSRSQTRGPRQVPPERTARRRKTKRGESAREATGLFTDVPPFIDSITLRYTF
jgi:hypothetical protein